MEQVNTNTERSVPIGHHKDWVVTKPESELSNGALKNDALHVSIGYDQGITDGVQFGKRIGFVAGCTLGILVGTIVTTIVLYKLKNDSH